MNKALQRLSNMTVRMRLMILTTLGLALTMTIWGIIQIKALDTILVEQQLKRLSDLAETVSTYYQHFPTRQGLSALDETLEYHIQSDVRLARIDIFSIEDGYIEYIVGAGRVPYEWHEGSFSSATERKKARHFELNIEGVPALALLYPYLSGKDSQVFIGVITFSQARLEILSRATLLLVFSSLGLLFAIFLLISLSYSWMIGKPLDVIINTIDEFRKGQYIKRIPITKLDEWGRLADHFNSMADEIEQVMAKNQELNRGLEERVQEATHKVVQLQKQVSNHQQLNALGFLTATMAHDLGTPLHSIAGMAKLLLEKEQWPPDVSRKLELIVQQTQRLNTTIQSVRRATRPPEPHLEDTSLQELLNETLSLVEPMIQKKNINLVMNIDNNLPSLYLDRYRIQTAIFNLIQNALEAMTSGGNITVSAYPLAPQDKMVCISVEDNGRGIPEEFLQRVFEPFFSTHTEEGLRGLGLAIVRDTVKIHGGSIEIKSQLNKGTTFVIYLPIIDAALTAETVSRITVFQ